MSAEHHQLDPAKFDPMLLAVIASRCEAIIREMSITVMKSSRSAAVTNGRDFSCGILTFDHRLVSVEEAMPIHVTALDLTTRPITEFFDDIKEGDGYLNNCPYTGGTHHGDMTLCMPVYCDGEPMFWALVRTHHSDTGMHVPTTMDPFAATVFEEGLHFPCVRFMENYEDKADLIRMCRMRIRVSHIWYGDYRAQVGGCRTGERRLKELVAHYGKDTIKAFVEAWMAYGERRAIASIRKFPKGTWSHETRHDPIKGVADEGIPVKATITVDPDEGFITVDVRDNIDCVPGGVNLSEACATGSCRIGVFYNLDHDIPHNHGSASRIKVLLRDGCVVGRPTYPVGTSVATTNVNDRLINAVAACFAKMGQPFGMAEGGTELHAGEAGISGVDSRKGSRPYVGLLCCAEAGGPGLAGYDGWVTWESPNGGGIMTLDCIEVDEASYPVLFEERRAAPDSIGHGEWAGAPGSRVTYRALEDDTVIMISSDGETFPPRGMQGGHDAPPAATWKRTANRELERLPNVFEGTLRAGDAITFVTCGGGGYGDPVRRDPARVAAAVNSQWVSPEIAERVYRVKLRRAANGVDWEVDAAETQRRRGAAGHAA